MRGAKAQVRRALRCSRGLFIGLLIWQLSPPAGVRAQEAGPAPAAEAATAPAVLSIGVVKGKAGTQVTIGGDADLAYEYSVIGGTNLVVDIPGATSRVTPPEQAIDDEAVSRVRVAELSGERRGVRVVFDLKRPDAFTIAGEGGRIVVSFLRPPGAAPPPPPPASAPEPAAAPASTPAERAAPATVAGTPAEAKKAYTGSRITLDFVDADLMDIFRLIADVSGVNILVSDDVRGKRSVKMTDVPWDQALDLILKTNVPQLVRVDEADNVISVTTLKRTLEDQAALDKLRLDQVRQAAEERRQLIESEAALKKLEAEHQAQMLAKVVRERQRSKGWTERTFMISYGDTKEVAERLRKFASGCDDGCVFEVGERSKTIFVRDFVDNVQRMNAIIAVLEAPTPAVLVEARIVEVQSDYARELGIQWGGTFTGDAAHGNATPFAFPNSIRVGGTAVQGSDGLNPGSYFVNLPAANPVAGAGLTLGHIANTLSLDIKLSAMERLGKTKILSNPKVLVVQNEEANINIGSQLPVPRTDAEGNRTIDWKDVGILLQVTPNVTSDGRVFMKLKIEKSAQGETVRTTEGEMFSIERRGAVTKVLVGDGETSVIGGIFQQTTGDADDGVPGLSKLPLVGWLFRARTQSSSRKELMIFLTPRITADPRDEAHATAGSAAAGSAAAAERPARAAVRSVFGTVTLLAADPLPPGDRVRALVRYANDTAFTFRASVTLNCRAFGADDRVVGAEVAHVWASEHGPIGPGFELQLEVPLAVEGGALTSLRCEAVEAE